jgi:allophanate hydrolase
MSGLPLNYQLTDVGGRYLDTRKTSDNYRLFALPGGPPYRPGLVKNKPGAGIELEIWRLSKAAFGHFVSQIPSPLGIGQVELENGDQVCGFLCEAHALADARDITEFTSWRKFLADIKDL